MFKKSESVEEVKKCRKIGKNQKIIVKTEKFEKVEKCEKVKKF